MRSVVLLVGLALAHSSFAAAEGRDRVFSEVDAPVERVFAPLGFDDNDNVNLVTYGTFPNSCYKVGPVTWRLVKETRTIELYPRALLVTGDDVACAQVTVPFNQSFSLGALPPGQYRVVLPRNQNIPAATVVIARAPSRSQDNFLYAPVESAHVTEKDADGVSKLILTGTMPHMFHGCMRLERVDHYMSPGNSLVVLPIAVVLSPAACAAQGVRLKFFYELPLRMKLLAGPLHVQVRTLNGQALNHIELIQ